MANLKISQLTESTAPGDNDLIPMVVGGDTVKVKKSALLDAVITALAGKLDKTGGDVGKLKIQQNTSVPAGYMGSCEDLLPGYSIFYISGNADHEASNSWHFRTNGTVNGGSVFVFCNATIAGSSAVAGYQVFQIEVPSGLNAANNQDQVLTNAQMMALAKPIGDAAKNLKINTQTGSYTLALTDRGGKVRMNVASANTVTVPPNSAVAFPIGTQIIIRQVGTGQTTIVAGSGVTLNSGDGLKFSKQGTSAAIVQVAINEWDVAGGMTT